MPGNTYEREKCMEKLNEMQEFLPFLDFMIEKIRKKSDLPLECQLSKFQHIRSVIIEKNGKYSLESLNNIKDILQKLITKLDYKGIYRKEKKETLGIKSESPKLPQDQTKEDQIKRHSLPSDVPETAAACPSTTKSASPNVVRTPYEFSKLVDSSNNTPDMIMKSVKMGANHSTRNKQDDKKEVLERNDVKEDSNVSETGGNAKNSKCLEVKSKESTELSVDHTSSHHDTDGLKACAPMDVLPSSRQTLVKSISGRERETGPKKKTVSLDSGDNKGNFGTDLKGTKLDEKKDKNNTVSDTLLSYELSDISDDDIILAEDIEENSAVVECSKNNVNHSVDGTLPKKEISTKSDIKLSEPSSYSIAYSVNEVSSKQKLRERLSLDIAEVHKVPGKSVGGSLRSLKDIKSCSKVKETASEPLQKISFPRESKMEYRSDSFENSSILENDRDLEKHSRREWTNKGSSRDREKRKNEKHHHRNEGEKEGRTVHSTKHSSRNEGKVILFKEEKKKRKKRLEIDKLDDAELIAFVKENISDLPHLSKLKPDELRKAARSSFALENLDSEIDEMEDKKEICEKKQKEMRDESQPFTKETVTSKKDTEVKGQTDTDYDDYDEYSLKLIEELTPSSGTRLEHEQTEAGTKLSVPELQSRENPSSVENKDPRTVQLVHSSDPQSDDHHRVSHRLKKFSHRHHISLNDHGNCDSRLVSNERSDDKQTARHHPPAQKHPTHDLPSNNRTTHHGLVSEHAKVLSANVVGNPSYNACETKTHDECKQLKKQGKESVNQRRLSLDSKLSFPEKSTPEELKIIEVKHKESEVKIKETLLSPQNKVKPSEDRNNKIRNTKTTNPKISSDTRRKTVEGERYNIERTDKSSLVKLSSQDDEMISPLENLYEEKCKSGLVRSTVLQDFKIPKKSRSISLDQQKNDGKDSQIRPHEAGDNKLASSSELNIDDYKDIRQESDEKHTTVNKCSVITRSKKSVTDHIQEQMDMDASSTNIDSELVTSPSNIQENVSVTKNASHDQMPTDKDKDNEKHDLDREVIEKKDNGSVKPTKELKSAKEIDKEKSVGDAKLADHEIEKVMHDKASAETSPEEMENNVKPKTESDVGSKSTITEEITQELVEALIRKSFESGEGELLLAKAKLFKELALKLNSKKLKTIQKIINSESDSSSSSSGSSTESGKRKKKRTRKKNSEETEKKSKKEKKTAKNKRSVDTSSESDDEIADDEKSNSRKIVNIVQSETAKEKVQSEESSESQGESPTKSKKSQRKTKLLEQIFNESPAKNFELSLDNQLTSEKEAEQKSKTKGKRGKTELDRLHEDVRNMFISSGVVTATGQRMCRILRESGGKVNNLDLVRESAKMVEEEKLASKKNRKLTTRSRSRSLDRRTLRDRSRSRSLLSGVDEDISKAIKNKPVVLLKKLSLEKMSYAYKITDFPESLTVKRGRNVARRGRGFSHGTTRTMMNEEIDLNKIRRIYLVRNLRKCLKEKNKTQKKEYKKKLSDIIQKLPLKMAKIQHLKIGSKESITKKTVKKNMPDKKFEYRFEEFSEILEYAFDKTKSAFSCLLCGFHTKSITAHYKTSHPESEVLISRLENSEAKKAIQDSKDLNYDITTLEQASSLEVIKRRVRKKLSNSTNFFCRMCSYGKSSNINQFFSHVSMHTGEYRYMCPVEGCDASMICRDNVRSHVISKHPNHKALSNKVVELFSLPSEHGNLFGYLCSRCNYVQILKKNVESHIQRVHGGVEDVRAIKIDMSGRASIEKGVKQREMKRRGKKGENDNDEEIGKNKNKEIEDLTSDDSQSDDDEDDEEIQNLGDENYTFEKDFVTDNNSKNENDEKPSKLQNDKTEENCMSDTHQIKVGVKVREPEMNVQKKTEVKSEVKKLSEEVLETVGEQKKWIVGPLEVRKLTNGVMIFNCYVGQCSYTTKEFNEFERHVLMSHESVVWTGVCDSCNLSDDQQQRSLSGIYTISDVWDHMASHVTSKEKAFAVKKIKDVKKELLDSSMDLESKSIEECTKQLENGEDSSENVPYPEKPLLRVRSLMGDRLSKPKSLSDEEYEELSQPECSLMMTDSANEHEKTNVEPLFTIKDVRSLNPDDEIGCPEETNFSEEVQEFFPPNAEVIAGKPILIRSCPSPKITISSEPESAFPISMAQTKQGIEVGQLIQMIPQPKVSEVPSSLNNLGFVATASIKILSPVASTTPTVIVPTFTTTPGLNALPAVLGTPQSVTVKESKKPPLKPILSKPTVPPTGSESVSLNKCPKRKRVSKSIPIGQNVSAQMGNTVASESSLMKGEQRHAIPISGRNIKDAKIYSEMLKKKKLCQLFKCMAIECSFTCNNETIFTQHIGLHEAQQRIKGKKKPLNKLKKIFNWQQCAYCCEVLVHTGSALSQHILTEHGHCLYQCAYCFYRAVSPTYVDLHQNTVHEKIIKDSKKLIYKCKPVPGADMAKQFEKQIKVQYIRPYQCERCGNKFLIIQHFIDHLTKKHQSVTTYGCHICKSAGFKIDSLLAHYKLHSYSMYQCAYCLHGTESQKEMLYHLWNFHFSQPPVIYVRILEDKAKTDAIGIDDLKLLTFDNEPIDKGHNLEDAGSEAEQDQEKKDEEPISMDLSTIVSELGIKVDDTKKVTAVTKTSKEMESQLPPSIKLGSMLPNAQFSSESDAKNDSATVCISSTLASVNDQEKKGRDASVPIGQLPIEVLESFNTSTIQKQEDDEKIESIDKILENFQKNNSSVSVSPVIENKPQVEGAPIRTVHKLPPTVPVSRSIITSVYQSKKVAIVKKLDESQTKETGPLLLHPLRTNPRISTDLVQAQGVILAVPVIDTLKNPCYGQGKDDTGATSSVTTGIKRAADEPPDTLKNVSDGTILKRICLGNPTTPAVFAIRPVQESSLKISDVRSLSTEKTSPSVLQPPIIRVEDFADKGKGSGDRMEPVETNKNKSDLKEKKNIEPPSSPEVIILDPEEDGKDSRNELVDVDSEDDGEDKKGLIKSKTKKIMSDKDLEIRKQMEQLRNQMENETDCLLLDDDANDGDGGGFNQIGKSEDSKNCFSTSEETNPSINTESISFDSQHPSEESSDKTITCGEGNTQDGDSRTNDSEESKNSRMDESESTNEKCVGKKAEKNIEKVELTGKELYLCGNGKCNFSAETDVELKDHLYICDFSRESTTLVCPHCSKNFKLSPSFVEHLKIHGVKKYNCGLCDMRSPLAPVVTRHMKHKHKFSQLKILPHDTKSGQYVVYPKNFKKEKQYVEMQLYSPGDEDKLPLQSIYQENVNCAKCPYFTKVRSNMVRHLKIHIKSVEAEGSIVVPSTAPTNPVPCLDTKERMFDKMTNLAASSQLAQANKDKFETLSPEEEAKLPQFVPEQMRHKCCSPDCNYLTIDDNMLKHHIKALHDEINVYSCPHCQETVHVEFRFVPLDKIGQHLKYHDARLYKCYHCTYFHHQKYIVEKHALEKHPERRFSVFTVREPKADLTPTVEEDQQNSSSKESIIKMWKCGICDNCESSVRVKVIEHLSKVHNCRSKFICKYCDTKSSQQSAFVTHFASKHNGLKVECVKALIQFNRTVAVSEVGQNVVGQEMSNDYFDTTPLWQRDAPRIRHIRGILIEEEEVKTKKTKKGSSESEMKPPPDMFHCPLCTDAKKVFRSKSAEAFRTHLYQELNYYQFACILCGKMFVDRKEFEKHHLRSHSNQALSLKQTKEDTEIIFWVDKVVAKQQSEIINKKRSNNCTSEECSVAKKKKIQGKTILESDSVKTKTNRSTRSSLEVKKEIDQEKLTRRMSDDKSEFVRQTRSTSASQSMESSQKCPHCDYNGTNLDNLKNHIKFFHLKMGKWLCRYCEESFPLEKDAMKHCKNNHPNEIPKASLNPDEVEDLKDDFWLVEYGFGREKQIKQTNDEEKPSTSMNIEKLMKKNPKIKPNIISLYSCGYCSLEVTDQNSIIEHFEIHHKDVSSEIGSSAIYYQCSICLEKLMDFDSLNSHAKNKHPNVTLQFEIRKVYKYDSKDYLCVKCQKKLCDCSKTNEIDNVKEGSYQCPECSMICSSYLDCIDHFNEHYPRYACSNCSIRFFTVTEMKEHQEQSQHDLPYSMGIPSENMLTEYKLGVKIMKDGVWVPLKTIKTSNLDDKRDEKDEMFNCS